ncbi:hypothetical protein BC828DRAFT_419032 [Blastocladiella britannica]|nr:hypothetical protein BC828DRAFT_419032 [Blastocladiella britannica]
MARRVWALEMIGWALLALIERWLEGCCRILCACFFSAAHGRRHCVYALCSAGHGIPAASATHAAELHPITDAGREFHDCCQR